MATSQHRCVFVGNIPYDASEEQLIQICEEVGPVVSFRLVTDRETGKPKGYGFCEYKDEETALSARRNLQGYEINGRQLRVDFAENDKNSDRNRDQGRGGPGMATNVDPAKQLGGPSSVVSSNFHQPIGLEVAMNAAAVMAGTLGGSQSSRELNLNGFQGQQTSYNDPLTLHLAKMSRNQLNEAMSELKVMSSQKKELARQLLLSSPQLSKALFQAQIMLGMVTQQMLQMPNIRQTSGPLAQLSSQDGLQGQHPVVHTPSGLPPLAHNKVQLGLIPRVHEAQVFSLHPNSLSLNQYSAVPQLPKQPRAQLPQQSQNQVLEQSISGISTFPSTRPPHLGGVTTRLQSLVATSSPVNQQMQLPLLQHLGQTGANLVQNIQPVAPTSTLQARPLLSDQRFQPGTSMRSGIPDLTDKVADRPAQFINASTWANSVDPYSSFPPGSSEKANMVHDTLDPMRRPSKLLKLDDGRSTSSAVGVNVSTSIPGPSQVSGPGLFGNQVPKAEESSNSEKQATQLPADVDPILLEQVLNLTPEQLSSLPPDQQQQVFQLQQMLR